MQEIRHHEFEGVIFEPLRFHLKEPDMHTALIAVLLFVLEAMSSGTLDLRAVTENHWSPGISTDGSGNQISNDPLMNFISYVNVGHSTHSDITLECGGGFRQDRGKGSHVQSEQGNNPYKPGDTAWLFFEALPWLGVDNPKGLDTMRLFVERFPYDRQDIPPALNYTLQFVDKIAEHPGYYDYQPWIDEYNWLTTIYSSDTERWYQSRVLLAMAEAEGMFNRNETVNLYWNIKQLFPFDSNTCNTAITSIREHQADIPEDTTPFHKIAIPPVPYGISAVKDQPVAQLNFSVAPNPANQSLRLEVHSPFSANITLELYDEIGNLVRSFSNEKVTIGSNTFSFSATQIPSGSYYLRLSGGGTVKTLKLSIEH